MEQNFREEKARSDNVMEKEAERCRRCYDTLEDMVAGEGSLVSLASIAVISSLGYADWRTPGDNWREGRPNLSSYYERLMTLAAFSETAPDF